MTPSFVLDCSAAASWCFIDEAAPQTRELLERLNDEAVVVPGIWRLEIINTLATAERRQRIKRADADGFLAMLRRLDIQVDEEGLDQAFDHVLALCRIHQLSSVDASYLELAMRRRLPLATLDESLRKAARKAGVKTLGQ